MEWTRDRFRELFSTRQPHPANGAEAGAETAAQSGRAEAGAETLPGEYIIYHNNLHSMTYFVSIVQ